jgi:type I restriction enzyme, S subunit
VSGWRQVHLGDLMADRSESIDPSKTPEEVFDLLSIPAFDTGSPIVCTGGSIGSSKQLVHPGDVLLSKIVPHIRRAWAVPGRRGRRMIASGEWIVFRGHGTSADFLRRLLVSDGVHRRIMMTVTGVGGSLLRARPAYVAKIPILLPPLAEQRRIAEVLDWVDALRAKRRTALAQLDELTQSIFLDMFGDPASNPSRFPVRPLGDVATKFSDGPFGSNLKTEHYASSGVRVVRLQNIGIGRFLDSDHAYVSNEHFTLLKKHECRPGDVLVGTLGEPNLRATIHPSWLRVAINKADCVQIRTDPAAALPEYICALLNQPSTLQSARRSMHGQTRVRISMGMLKQLSVPVPPLDLQEKFANRQYSISQIERTMKKARDTTDRLFASLQHRAFRGEL